MKNLNKKLFLFILLIVLLLVFIFILKPWGSEKEHFQNVINPIQLNISDNNGYSYTRNVKDKRDDRNKITELVVVNATNNNSEEVWRIASKDNSLKLYFYNNLLNTINFNPNDYTSINVIYELSPIS